MARQFFSAARPDYANDTAYAQLENDVVKYMVWLFSQRFVYDLTNAPNNRRRDLEIAPQANGVDICWQVARPKGFAQWSTGKDYKRALFAEMTNTPLTLNSDQRMQLKKAVMDAVIAETGFERNGYGCLQLSRR